MIKEGALDGAGLIFCGHLDRHYRPGTIVVSEGAVNASSDNFTVEMIGQGAHRARPHESIDAVVVGNLMIMALQTIVSREVDPSRPSVVSVGQFHAGTTPNVIAGQAQSEGTVWAQDAGVRRHLLNSVRRVAQAIAQLHGAKIHITGKLPSVTSFLRKSLAPCTPERSAAKYRSSPPDRTPPRRRR